MSQGARPFHLNPGTESTQLKQMTVDCRGGLLDQVHCDGTSERRYVSAWVVLVLDNRFIFLLFLVGGWQVAL